jgi:hypothetical protein
MTNSIVVIDRVTRVASLGVRFLDTVTNTVVGNVLTVSAYPQHKPALRVAAVANSSGVYVLQNLPGLRDVENGAGDQDYWDHLPPRSPFTVEVSDPDERFLPFVFDADLPVKSLFDWACGSSPLSPPLGPMLAVPLYSTPRRRPPDGMAVIHVDLLDPVTDPLKAIPAAWAVLEAYLDGRLLARGIADTRGCVALMFPYPAPIDFVPASPLETGVALVNQKWTLHLQVLYRPQSTVPTVPDLCTVLSQPAANLWGVWAEPARRQTLADPDLRYGEELVVRSRDPDDGRPLPTLFVTPV